MENLKDKTAKGLFWGTINSGSTQVLNLIIGIVLGRLLTPEDYGIVGVLAIFIALAGTLQASGFTYGLINIKHPKDNDYNSVFWFNISTSIILYIILFFCAPLIANFFSQPCLVNVSRVLFLSLPISALGIACNAYMVKNMMNREIAIISLISLIISGSSGIVLAILGHSYWSLVWQQLIYISIFNIGRYYYIPWRPSFSIDTEPVKKMFSFSVKLLLTNIISIINGNLLTALFGRLFPINSVGNYTQANKWNGMSNSIITGAVNQITQTVFVSISENRDREIRVFRKLIRFAAFLSFPMILCLALVAQEFIVVALGEKWADSGVLLQILCIGGAFTPLYGIYQNLIISCGRSDIYMWGNVWQIIVQLVIVFTLFQYGITTIVWGYSVLNILWLVVWQFIANRLLGIRYWDVIKDIIPFLIISIAAIIAAYIMTSGINNNLILLTTRVFIVGILYLGTMKLLKVKIFEECSNFILSKLTLTKHQ